MTFQNNLTDVLNKFLISHDSNSNICVTFIPILNSSCDQIKLFDNNKFKQFKYSSNICLSKGHRCIQGDLNMISDINGANFYKSKTQSVDIDQNFLVKTFTKTKIKMIEFPSLTNYDCEYDYIEYTCTSDNITVIITKILNKNEKNDKNEKNEKNHESSNTNSNDNDVINISVLFNEKSQIKNINHNKNLNNLKKIMNLINKFFTEHVND